jgi:hypothetical protein
MSLTDTSAPACPSISAVDFLKILFKHTAEQVYICSFSNDRDDPNQVGERHVITRTPAQITSFAEKWDKPGRGMFSCVGTVKAGAKRNKENIVETTFLHADIDFKNVDLLGNDPRGDVLRHLARLKYIPSAIVFSGNGIHAYWLLKESLATQENIERIEMALRLLADVVAGDLAVCEVARVMRLPGTHNTKNGAWSEVEVMSLDGDRRYELDDLEEWLSEVSPIMLRRKREHGATLGERDPFLEYANQCGYRPPIDVEQRLKDMMYMGSGDSSIHET